MEPLELLSDIERFIATARRFQIDQHRLELLARFANLVSDRIRHAGGVRLTFICTHNSRRSHFAQVWAAVAAARLGLDAIETFSGGTEVTALHPNTAAALARAGFEIESDDAAVNPRYRLTFSPERPPLTCFSKIYNDPPNPTSGYIAVMTCTHADANCPIVRGADVRVSLPCEDPRESDGTPRQDATYDERCAEIAGEMLFAFSRVAELLRGGG